MGRHKTISDVDVLAVARDVFRTRGHAASTREIARIAGISEGVLYQRFGSKDALFFAAMVPSEPDLEDLLGPKCPPDDAHGYLRAVVERMAGYFAGVLPIAVQVMTHPSFDVESLKHGHPAATARLEEALVARLRALEQRKGIAKAPLAIVARLLVGLAHEWALREVVSATGTPATHRELTSMVDVAWHGLAPVEGGIVPPSAADGRSPGHTTRPRHRRN